MFDIRNYEFETAEKTAANSENDFWTVKFLKNTDSNFPNINKECKALYDGRNPRTEDAFNNKLDAWKNFTTALQKLCKLYKIKDAECLKDMN